MSLLPYRIRTYLVILTVFSSLTFSLGQYPLYNCDLDDDELFCHVSNMIGFGWTNFLHENEVGCTTYIENRFLYEECEHIEYGTVRIDNTDYYYLKYGLDLSTDGESSGSLHQYFIKNCNFEDIYCISDTSYNGPGEPDEYEYYCEKDNINTGYTPLDLHFNKIGVFRTIDELPCDSILVEKLKTDYCQCSDTCEIGKFEWNPVKKGTSGTVYALRQHNNKLFVGGYSLYVEGNPSIDDNLLSWDGNNWDIGAIPGIGNLGVRSIESGPDGLYVGGHFTSIGGNSNLSNIARWDGSAWHSLGKGLSNTVHDIHIVGSDVYVAGEFTEAGGNQNANKIAKWDGSSWNPLGKGVNSGTVQSVQSFEGDIYIGGSFSTVNGSEATFSRGISRFDGLRWYPLSGSCTTFGPNSKIWDIHIFEDELYFAGNITRLCNGKSLNHGIMKHFNGSLIDIGNNVSRVHTMHTHENLLYIGGYFENAGNDEFADHLAVYNGDDWENVNQIELGQQGWIYSIESYRGDLYIGGSFTNANGNPDMNRIARLGCGSDINSAIINRKKIISSLEIYPNPSHSKFEINFTIDLEDLFTIQILDIYGKVVETVYNGNLLKDIPYSFTWNPELTFKSGTYILSFISSSGAQNEKLTLIH